LAEDLSVISGQDAPTIDEVEIVDEAMNMADNQESES
jgi:hypothetical protein